MLSVSRSGYYEWRQRKESKREQENRSLLARIQQIFETSKKTYGSPRRDAGRIHQALRQEGIIVSEPRVTRLMKKAGLRVTYRRRFVKTTDTDHTFPLCENLLAQKFDGYPIASAWASDITAGPPRYIATRTGCGAARADVFDHGDGLVRSQSCRLGHEHNSENRRHDHPGFAHGLYTSATYPWPDLSLGSRLTVRLRGVPVVTGKIGD